MLPPLPRRMVPYLAHPVQTVRILRSDDMARAFAHERNLAWMQLTGAVAVATTAVAVFVAWARPAIAAALVVELALVIGYRLRNSASGLRHRGLPAGELTRLATSLIEPGYIAKHTARHGPVFTTSTLARPTVVIAGIERGVQFLRDHRDALKVPDRPDSALVDGEFVRNQYGDRHRATRSALAIAFSLRSIEATQPAIDSAVGRHLASWVGDAVDPAERVDAMVLEIWISVVFGVDPISDRDLHARLVELFESCDYMNPQTWPHAKARELHALVVVQAQRAATLAPCALRTLADRAPAALADPVILGNLIHLVHTSRFDVSGLMVWLLYYLARHPTWCDHIRASDDDDPADWAVAETLRLSQSEYVIRESTCPISVGDATVPTGWFVRVAVREAHRDPALFGEPAEFQPCRFAAGPLGRDRYAPFGLDHRTCLGDELTKATGRALATAACRGYSVRVVADGPPQVSYFRFWAPSGDLRLQLDRTQR